MELGSCRRIRLEPTDLQGCIDLPGLTMEHGDIRKVYSLIVKIGCLVSVLNSNLIVV